MEKYNRKKRKNDKLRLYQKFRERDERAKILFKFCKRELDSTGMSLSRIVCAYRIFVLFWG